MIQTSTLEEHTPNTVYVRRVRIAFDIAESVMLAVNCHPLLGNHASCQPQPESHEMTENRMEYDSFVRLTSM
jgi:hypothetical protein